MFEVQKVVKNRVVTEKRVVIERRELWFENERVLVEKQSCDEKES